MLDSRILAIDNKVNDYLNNAFVKIENDIQIKNVSEASKIGLGFAQKYAAKLLNSG
mgnify:CR=1 FL=1